MRIRKRTIVTTIVLLAVAALAIGFARFDEGLNQYCNVKRTDRRADVLYRLGYPPEVIGPVPKNGGTTWENMAPVYWTDAKVNPKNAMPSGTEVKDYNEWTYTSGDQLGPDGMLSVEFDPLDSSVISISCMGFTANSCPPLATVRWNDTEDQVERKLGAPTRSALDGVSKTLWYDDVGLRFYLTKGRVYMLTLIPPKRRAFALLRYIRTML